MFTKRKWGKNLYLSTTHSDSTGNKTNNIKYDVPVGKSVCTIKNMLNNYVEKKDCMFKNTLWRKKAARLLLEELPLFSKVRGARGRKAKRTLGLELQLLTSREIEDR